MLVSMKRILGMAVGVLASSFLLLGCAEQEQDADTVVETPPMGAHSATTNIQDDATASAPGSGATVGADPSGAGTKPLRDETQPE